MATNGEPETADQLREAYKLHNLELTQGFKILNELENDGKVTLEK
jgi:hypothetical protein